ncbi:hypothetical protein HBA55_35785 [Pseudomaricurvus alkylphenolicus]|uniref:hypothetical protein n=1 Tax=Pseudomaricurvus alkylphenolicus TaxID=1306991 RepID=UPI00141E87A5|nr:hypothetical protein [Pseudomaricurvus alkylphenolicus]NIB44996.1 hypothetical protein [Pseudomaricurvus alkylphenolicus]
MDNINDTFFTVRVLLSIALFGCTIIPMLADFNKTHATNPLWTGHARYHVVWQCISYGWLGIFALYLLWFYESESVLPLYITAIICASIYGGFFMALMFKSLYGGKTYDENGYLPIAFNIGGKTLYINQNITAFSVMVAVLSVAVYMLF